MSGVTAKIMIILVRKERGTKANGENAREKNSYCTGGNSGGHRHPVEKLIKEDSWVMSG